MQRHSPERWLRRTLTTSPSMHRWLAPMQILLTAMPLVMERLAEPVVPNSERVGGPCLCVLSWLGGWGGMGWDGMGGDGMAWEGRGGTVHGRVYRRAGAGQGSVEHKPCKPPGGSSCSSSQQCLPAHAAYTPSGRHLQIASDIRELEKVFDPAKPLTFNIEYETVPPVTWRRSYRDIEVTIRYRGGEGVGRGLMVFEPLCRDT